MSVIRPATILVVEDEAAVRKLIREVLREEGYQVLEADNGEQAISIFRAHDPPVDLAIIDIGLPGMGGLDVASVLDLTSGTVKVLYMSGMGGAVSVESLASGAPGLLLRKPFSPDQLLDRVRRLLG